MTGRVVALSGGIGGAKLALGLYRVLPPRALTVVCNTGDDFEHLGLTVCPDIDTVMYTLAGLSNRVLGWGRAGETWSFMEALAALGGETWFQLGDGDLATHVERTRRLAAGETLTDVTRAFARTLGIGADILPMSDAPVRTVVHTPGGPLPFQRYFVEQRCAPEVTGFTFEGAAGAIVPDPIAAALTDPGLAAVVICPSNPLISIDPILAVPGMREALRASPAPLVAISPIIAGRAVKGPTAKMLAELGLPTNSTAVAAHYGDLLDGFVIDTADAGEAAAIGLPCLTTPTLMTTDAEKQALAERVLAFATTLSM
jgi:LPPG:FO 2-phospho-L-lactate transferase